MLVDLTIPDPADVTVVKPVCEVIVVAIWIWVCVDAVEDPETDPGTKCCVYRDGSKYTTFNGVPCLAWYGSDTNGFWSSYPGQCNYE